MTITQYYRHCRSLGQFRAVECLALARKAAALDEKARLAKLPPAGAASWEAMPDGSDAMRLSFSIKVF